MEANYYAVGTRDNPVISNSSLSALNPEEGGSPIKFLQFFDERDEETESKALERGKLLHKYIEDASSFAVASVVKPGGMLGDLLENLYKVCLNIKGAPEFVPECSVELTSDLKTPAGRSAAILETRVEFEKLGLILELNEEQTIKAFRIAKGDLYSSYDESTTVKKILKEGIPYYKQLGSLDGKKTLTVQEKYTIDRMTTSLFTNPAICSLLNLGRKDGLSEDGSIEVYTELEIYFDLVFEGLSIPAKAKLDKVNIDHTNKVVRIIDPKSIKGSLYTFRNSFEFYRYYRQLPFYRKAFTEWLKQQNRLEQFKDYTYQLFNIPVETTGNFLSSIYLIGPEYRAKGIAEIMQLLGRFHWHKANNIWNISREEHEGNGVMILKPKIDGIQRTDG